MIETREKEINSHMYAVTQLPARRALRLQYKLVKIFGPAFAVLFRPTIIQGANGNAMLNLGIDQSAISSAIMSVVSQMDELTYETLVAELLQGVRCDGKELRPEAVDMHFAGDLPSLMKILWFVLETNFDSFFGERGFGSLWQETDTEEPTSTPTESLID
jgi:hypothetical protein